MFWFCVAEAIVCALIGGAVVFFAIKKNKKSINL